MREFKQPEVTQFVESGGDRVLRVGDAVRVVRSSGEMDSGWKVGLVYGSKRYPTVNVTKEVGGTSPNSLNKNFPMEWVSRWTDSNDIRPYPLAVNDVVLVERTGTGKPPFPTESGWVVVEVGTDMRLADGSTVEAAIVAGPNGEKKTTPITAWVDRNGNLRKGLGELQLP